MSSGHFLELGAFGYLLASVFYGANLLKAQRTQQTALLQAGRLAGVLGLVLHTAAIGLHCLYTHHTPISTAPEAFSATGWAIVIVYFGLEIVNWRKPPSAIGAVAFPIAFLSVFTGSAIYSARHSILNAHVNLLDSSLVSLHILAIVFAFGLLTLAAVCSLFYLIEHRLLKKKRGIGTMFAKLPPLATVDHLAFTLVCLAFPLLTLGCIAGMIRAASVAAPITAWIIDAKTLASIVCWAFYGLYLWAHATATWQGLRANYLLLAGMVAALLTYFAPSTFHHFS